MASSATDYRFFLGGTDLEMLTIKTLLEQNVPDKIMVRRLSWGAAASSYEVEIDEAFAHGQVPVLIELLDDVGAVARGAILIDHHGTRSGKERASALRQVFDLLGMPEAAWTRWFELVEANDVGYIPAMLAMQAGVEEVREVREADRRAQGITPAQEQAADQALQNATQSCDGRLTSVELSHSGTATVTDRLSPVLGGEGYQNLLITSPREINVFGEGKLVQALAEQYPGGWYGGALPDYGFWGHALDSLDAGSVRECVEKLLSRIPANLSSDSDRD